ncbi:Glycosyltransferase involved in cell wall bisynthesis [Flavobacterium micromati]|uniref:Glycosyltransferase involved in cell wall bisynthesis n=1 Tax=Flavobacterium micromati TaxID=229205 RepID=A0A1M5H7M8_9FLAO|nr:glycosyltransferase family 4 protein [Flavobacterium micromati]SHG11722.1 Glycosyltransferase involved in cell wall bisynthesis [Flavobacterium micromati]
MLKKRKLFFFFIPHHHIGGAERVHLNIIKALPSKPIVFFDYSSSNQIGKDFEDSAYCFLITSAKRRMYAFKFIQFLGTIFHVTLFGCNSGLFYNFVSRLNGKCKTIDLTHAFSFPEKGIEMASLPHVNLLDKRIVINSKTFEDYKQLYCKNNVNQELLKRISIIPNGIEIKEFYQNKINSRWENFTIGYVGRNSPEKRPELFFEIVNQTQVKAKIIGDDFALFKKEFPDVIYFENCNNKELIREQFSEISLLVVTSSREGFPLVVMEAMELGIPVLATDVGSISEHLINYQNGFIGSIEKKSFLNFASTIIFKLIKNKELYTNLSLNARDHAVVNFNINKFQSKYRELFYE